MGFRSSRLTHRPAWSEHTSGRAGRHGGRTHYAIFASALRRRRTLTHPSPIPTITTTSIQNTTLTSFGLITPSQSRCLRAATGGRGVNLLYAPGLPAARGDAARPGFAKMSVPPDRFRNWPCTIVDPSTRLAVHPEPHHEKHEIYEKHEKDQWVLRSLGCVSNCHVRSLLFVLRDSR